MANSQIPSPTNPTRAAVNFRAQGHPKATSRSENLRLHMALLLGLVELYLKYNLKLYKMWISDTNQINYSIIMANLNYED